MKKHNFFAGPSILPQYTFDQCSKAVMELDGMGLSLLEISHRSKEFIAILENTRQLFVDLLGIPEGYEVLFIQGGASMQFCMVPYNLLRENGKSSYIETGTWSENAIAESRLFGNTEIAASSKNDNFRYIPKKPVLSADADYLHITTNNTIYGTQYHKEITAPIPVVADMSSDILSKTIDVSKYGLIYAGAQKNIGPSGLTIVIVKKDLLGKTGRKIPSMLDYQKYIDKGSMYNTPPTFAIYTTLQTLTWLKNEGGISVIEQRNNEKAQILYHELDRNTLFTGNVYTEDRSKMNVTFHLEQPELESDFLAFCDTKNIAGLQGHRSVGGFRASIYNAMPITSVQVLVDALQEFEKSHG